MLKDKTVILGVTGSIAAYKTANLASMLVKLHCDVHVIMTANAAHFINPITFETLTGNKCLVETFDRNFQFHVAHVSLAKKADLLMVAPASANMIAKLACGLADDMLSTTALACTCKKIVAPAMNTNMYHNPVVQENIGKLTRLGYTVELLLDYILREIAYEKDLLGKKVLVTAGPTQESIDPVRYITNHSSGKMGYELAKAATRRGADVILVSGKTALEPLPFVRTIPVISAEDMYQAVKDNFLDRDIVIKAAAVADYRPKNVSDEKIKKKENDDMSIPMERTRDIIQYIGENRKQGQFVCGFSMETQNMIENSRAKLYKKNIDMIVANNLKVAGSGFETDTNIVTIITREKEIPLAIMSKEEVANKILDVILSEMKNHAEK